MRASLLDDLRVSLDVAVNTAGLRAGARRALAALVGDELDAFVRVDHASEQRIDKRRSEDGAGLLRGSEIGGELDGVVAQEDLERPFRKLR